ncbi:hypothetical protein CLIB1423_11S03730 [[Candida] railenensis]|uniref:Uncharacterized protein n=1 Tax=[Candida] railenensis TaxID=45579 RepID=A0A9P0QRJ8_9ASCO|nr:hypothetical protein CLIB1423_11S03730 [[Candida] railenensis]
MEQCFVQSIWKPQKASTLSTDWSNYFTESMDNIYTSLSLSLIAEKRFSLNCKNGKATIDSINEYILIPSSLRFLDIDLSEIFENNDGEIHIDDLITKEPVIIFWRNADKITSDQQMTLVKFLNEFDEYDTNESRLKKSNPNASVPAIVIENSSTTSSTTTPATSNSSYKYPLTIILVIENNLNIIQQLRYKFWFCQYYSRHSLLRTPTDIIGRHYLSRLRKVQQKTVFVAPDIQRYIYSLIVHTRNHRLCSISPMETRLPTMTIQSVQLLAETYVRWTSLTHPIEDSSILFVTPDVCKIVMRKVGYWLINWQKNLGKKTSARKEEGDEEYIVDNDRIHRLNEAEGNKQTERIEMLKIASLGGDWYGTDWKFIQNYIQRCEGKGKEEYNVIVEDALHKVQPPV